ncbi:MAG TPA: hypothetical protein VEK73_16655 [Xanthobacteraceae bacterium]|nr:hypothetical protein [Xanthobacteraceae bacterium]
MAMPNDAGEQQSEPAAAASGDIPTVEAPSIDPAASDPSPIAAAGDREEPIQAEPARAQAAGAAETKPPPTMPRAAVLVLRPDDKPHAAPPEVEAPASARAGGRRFALLAAGLTVAAAIGAIAGSAGIAGIEHLFVASPIVATRSEGNEEVRVLKEQVAQLRMNVKTLSDNLSALRTTIATSTTAASVQFAKIAEALDRVEHARTERHVTTLAPSPEPTASIPAPAPAPAAAPVDPKAAPKPAIVEGWTLRRVYGADAALIEGRYGVVEIEPGDLVPGLGRIQEIKRQQDGRWAVVTPRGLIVSPH